MASALPPAWTDWHADPSILIGTVLLCAAYAYRARQLGGTDEAPGKGRMVLFASAVLTVIVALASPLHDLGERYLFSAHMAQHLLLIMVMPPLLLASLTAEMVRPLVHRPAVMRALRFLTRPVIAYAACNFVFGISHLPLLYDLSLRSHDFHVFEHILFMSTAVLLWWPLLSPLSELPRINYPSQLLYVFLQVLPGSLIGGMISHADRPIYAFYAAAPRIVGLSAVQDQQLGAIVMWVGGGTFWLITFTVIFFKWAAQDMAEGRAHAAAHDRPSRP